MKFIARFMVDLQRRLLNFVIALDQLIWVVITLGNGLPDETISAALWRMELQGKPAGKLRPVVDFILRPFGEDHCLDAYLAEVERQQINKIYKRRDIHE